MVYEKFIKRGGKTFGPYYYESYRDGKGNVKTRYLENYKLFNWKKFMFVVVLILVLGVAGFLLL